MTSSAKFLSVHLRTKWLWFRIPLLSLKLQIWHLLEERSSMTFKETRECGFTLKLVRNMITTLKQMHCPDKNSQHSLIIWPVWLNVWKLVCELSDWGFKYCYCHLRLDVGLALSKEVLDNQARYRVWIHFETSIWHDDNNIKLNALYR